MKFVSLILLLACQIVLSMGINSFGGLDEQSFAQLRSFENIREAPGKDAVAPAEAGGEAGAEAGAEKAAETEAGAEKPAAGDDEELSTLTEALPTSEGASDPNLAEITKDENMLQESKKVVAQQEESIKKAEARINKWKDLLEVNKKILQKNKNALKEASARLLKAVKAYMARLEKENEAGGDAPVATDGEKATGDGSAAGEAGGEDGEKEGAEGGKKGEEGKEEKKEDAAEALLERRRSLEQDLDEEDEDALELDYDY